MFESLEHLAYNVDIMILEFVEGLVWFDVLRPSQQLWSCRDGQFT